MKRYIIIGIGLLIAIVISFILVSSLQDYRIGGGIDRDMNCIHYSERCRCIGLLKTMESYPAQYSCSGIQLCDSISAVECKDGSDGSTETFTEIETCVIDTPLLYSSGISVNNVADAIRAADKYVEWSKEADEGLDGSDWEIWDAEIHGLYKGKRYWTITYSYLSEYSSERGNSQFDVNEDGEIRVFLGCI